MKKLSLSVTVLLAALVMLCSCMSAEQPTDIIGRPDSIYIVVNQKETIIEPGERYNEILSVLHASFPEKLKEASKAVLWYDGTGTQYSWEMMAEDFDYLRLAYNTPRTAKVNNKEISFENLTFPLSADAAGIVIVDTSNSSAIAGKTFGPVNIPVDKIINE